MPAHALVLGIKRAAVLLTLAITACSAPPAPDTSPTELTIHVEPETTPVPATTARLRGLIIVTARGMESMAFPYDNLAPQDFTLPIANSYWSGPQDHVRVVR